MDLAKRDGMIADIGAQLQQYRAMFRANAGLQQVLENPSIDLDVKLDILRAIFERTQPAPFVKNFLILLAQKDRLRHFDSICQHFERLANEELHRVVAQVTTATTLEAEQRQAVINKIAAMTQKEVILESQVDPSLLGGLVIRVDHVVLDGSLRGQLARMRKELVGG